MRYILLFFIILTALMGDDYDYHSKRHINKELSHLHLSKEQNRQIKKILKEFKHDLKEFREIQEEIEEQREDVFLQERLDIDELNRLNIQLDTISSKIENKLLKRMHAILNKKQRKRFIEYFDDWEVD